MGAHERPVEKDGGGVAGGADAEEHGAVGGGEAPGQGDLRRGCAGVESGCGRRAGERYLWGLLAANEDVTPKALAKSRPKHFNSTRRKITVQEPGRGESRGCLVPSRPRCRSRRQKGFSRLLQIPGETEVVSQLGELLVPAAYRSAHRASSRGRRRAREQGSSYGRLEREKQLTV